MQKMHFHVLNGVLVVAVAIVAAVHVRASIRLTALVGSVWLAMVFLVPIISRWAGVMEKNGLAVRGWLEATMTMRKQLGLWAATWLTAHAVLSVFVYFEGVGQFVRLVGEQPVTMLELASLSILLLMAMTSNNWSRLHLPGWKYVHLLVWAIPGMALVSSVLAARDTLDQLPLLGIAPLLFGLCVVGGLVAFAMKHRRQRDDWLRLGFLLAGCAAALVVWTAA